MRNLCLAKSLEKKLGTKTKCFLIYFDNDRLPISKKINSKCFIIQDDIIPNLERENLSEKIIESLKLLLKNNVKQKDFQKELTLLNLTDEQKELINKYTFESYSRH